MGGDYLSIPGQRRFLRRRQLNGFHNSFVSIYTPYYIYPTKAASRLKKHMLEHCATEFAGHKDKAMLAVHASAPWLATLA